MLLGDARVDETSAHFRAIMSEIILSKRLVSETHFHIVEVSQHFDR